MSWFKSAVTKAVEAGTKAVEAGGNAVVRNTVFEHAKIFHDRIVSSF